MEGGRKGGVEVVVEVIALVKCGGGVKVVVVGGVILLVEGRGEEVRARLCHALVRSSYVI